MYHDNISHESISLRERWPDNGPPVLWSVDLGEGYAGPAVMNGCVYLLDYDEIAKTDSLRCFSLDNGKEIWRRSYAVKLKRNHGMSRTIPAVTEHYVVTLGPKCHVMCVDAKTGEFKWGMDLEKDYGTEVPLWYTGQCPLIDGSRVILAPCGDSLMIAVDCETGKVVWRAANQRGFKMSHSSIVPMVIHGVKMYVYCGLGGMAGVGAEGPGQGKILWQTAEWSPDVVAPSPVQLPDNRIFVTAGYGVGSAMFQVKYQDGIFLVNQLSKFSKEEFACEQQTPIFYNNCLFGILPNDAGPLKRQMVCMEPEGRILWSSGQDHRFGFGPFLIADGKMLILDDYGELTMIKASTQGYVQLDQAKVLEGRDSWGPMAIVGGRLLLRDLTRLTCLDLRNH